MKTGSMEIKIAYKNGIPLLYNIIFMKQENTIILHTYNDMQEALMMQGKLKESGIDSFVKDENLMGLDPVGGVELLIFEKDKEVAEKIITS
jgi:hypothetical protein